ncbi:MAG TPA: amino acid adenylation domain-containing protein, partial [Mycobacterium sp.]|nr:amino acid adenylation domain-containing protein [Mycobacterium sp.]
LSYRITGPVDVDRLHRALDAVAVRHTALRTTYRADGDGEPRPVTDPGLRPGWAEHDLSDLAEQPQRLRLEVLAQREFSRPFELPSESPLRITLVRIGPAELVLLITAHPIAWDDGSSAPFFTDLTRAYRDLHALDGAAPTPVITSPDETGSLDEELDYWRTLVTDLPEPLELPGPNGSVVPSDWRCQHVAVRLAASTVDRVNALAREAGATPYLVLLTAFGAVVHRYTHATDFLVATSVSSRGAATEDAIGYHGNSVVMRMRPLRRQTFRQLLAETCDTAAAAFAHQRVNLDWLVGESDPDRRGRTERMTRLGFGLRQRDGSGFCPPGVHCQRYELRGQFGQLPLGVAAEPTADGGALVEAEYLTEVLDRPLVCQLLEHYRVLLDSALTAPDTALAKLTLMRDTDLDWLRDASTGEPFSTPATTLDALFTKQVRMSPDAVAVVYEDRRYTYREINEEANRLAHWLLAQGIGTEDRVAVLLDKSPELVIATLGILKAGATYLPIDPTYPEDRLAFILDDSDPEITLRELPSNLAEHSPADPTGAELVRPLRPDNTAYLIYTSGSTGLPKGVPVPHAPIAEYFVWFRDEYQVDADDRLLQVASPSFDASIAEIYGTLTCGARLVIPRPDGLRDIGYLTSLLHREGITSMHFVPSLLGLFLSLPGVDQWRTLRRVPIGGEPLPGEVADKFHATFDALLYNFYGPTETVVNATSYPVVGTQGSRIVPIGKPKINTQVHLLDAELQPVPVGVIGELYIGGTHLAHNYHRRRGLTSERFVADPFTTGGRLYRSGDLARRNADGNIEFVGRADEQVKIRGFRIELGEVAAAISVDPSVGQAVVVAADLPQLGKSLVGYVTPAGNGEESVDVDRIRTRVAAALPDYMTPAAYVVLSEIPITTHGKIDRDALPPPEITPAAEYRAVGTDTERRVAELFSRLLGRDPVGADDSFFDLGGHSLVATRLAAAIRAECGVEIGVRDIFDAVTVARLAERVDQLAAGAGTARRPKLIATNHDRPMPLSAAQLRTWFSYRVDGPSLVNNIPFAARLSGPCDAGALAAAVGDLIARHEILRTTYTEIDGVPHQIINPAGDVPVRSAAGRGEEWLAEQLGAERRESFDLEHDWPIRAAVLQTGSELGEAHVISLVVHHIAIDHWSGGVLFADLLTAYRARRAGHAPVWTPLPLQYADYAAWQAELLAEDGGIAGDQHDYWVHQLAGLPEDTGLRPDFPRRPVPSDAGDSVDFSIDMATRARLAALCREAGITEFMLLQSAVAVLLHKTGSGTDIPIGTPVAARSEPELDQLIGFFINILVLRNDLAGNPTLRELLSRARDTALTGYANQDLPFDRVVDAVGPTRSLVRNPLFQVVVHVRDQLPAERAVDSGPDGTTVFSALEPTFDIAHADLSVNFFTSEDSGDIGYTGNVLYR